MEKEDEDVATPSVPGEDGRSGCSTRRRSSNLQEGRKEAAVFPQYRREQSHEEVGRQVRRTKKLGGRTRPRERFARARAAGRVGVDAAVESVTSS